MENSALQSFFKRRIRPCSLERELQQYRMEDKRDGRKFTDMQHTGRLSDRSAGYWVKVMNFIYTMLDGALPSDTGLVGYIYYPVYDSCIYPDAAADD